MNYKNSADITLSGGQAGVNWSSDRSLESYYALFEGVKG